MAMPLGRMGETRRDFLGKGNGLTDQHPHIDAAVFLQFAEQVGGRQLVKEESSTSGISAGLISNTSPGLRPASIASRISKRRGRIGVRQRVNNSFRTLVPASSKHTASGTAWCRSTQSTTAHAKPLSPNNCIKSSMICSRATSFIASLVGPDSGAWSDAHLPTVRCLRSRRLLRLSPPRY